MADTVDIPKLGPIRKEWLIGGGALAAGVVGYAWWRKGMAGDGGGTVEGTVPSESVTADETVGAGASGNVQYAGTDVNESDFVQPTTNAEWSNLAIERVTTLGGFDATLAATAIGKFLARQALTDAEAAVVMSARALTGDPPQNGPWLIVHGTGDTTTPPPAPTSLGAPAALRVVSNGGGRVGLDWNPLTGAVRYRVTIRNLSTGFTSSKYVTSSAVAYSKLRRGMRYTVYVSGVTSAGRVGTRASITFKVV